MAEQTSHSLENGDAITRLGNSSSQNDPVHENKNSNSVISNGVQLNGHGHHEMSAPPQNNSSHSGSTCCGVISYMHTVKGLLKLAQTLFGIVALGCGCGSSITNVAGSALYFLLFVLLLSSLNSLFSLLFYEIYGSPEEKGLTNAEMLYNALSSILLFIADLIFIIVFAVATVTEEDRVIISLTIAFSSLLLVFYVISFFLSVQSHKNLRRHVSPKKQTDDQSRY